MPGRTTTPKVSVIAEVAEVQDSPTIQEEVAPATRMVTYISEGNEYQVEIMDIDNRHIVVNSVYKEVLLPYSKRTTKILVAAQGTQIRI